MDSLCSWEPATAKQMTITETPTKCDVGSAYERYHIVRDKQIYADCNDYIVERNTSRSKWSTGK